MKDAEFAILSIIAEAPITGYDMQDVIAARNLRLWTMIGVESVYYVLEKLETQGLIENIDDQPPTDKRSRLYRITSAGMGVLQTGVTDLLATPRHLPDRFDIGLANIPVLRTTQTENALISYRAGLQSRSDDLQEQLAELQVNGIPFHIDSLFQHQIALVQAEIVWFDSWFESWKAQALPDPEILPKQTESFPRMQQVILPDDPDSFHKHATRQHQAVSGDEQGADVEFPPPPQKRSDDKTRISQKTPPRVFDDDQSQENKK